MARNQGGVGDSVSGKIVHCEYRKSEKERLIRRTVTHRGRAVNLHHAACTVTKAYRQSAAKAPGKAYAQA